MEEIEVKEEIMWKQHLAKKEGRRGILRQQRIKAEVK